MTQRQFPRLPRPRRLHVALSTAATLVVVALLASAAPADVSPPTITAQQTGPGDMTFSAPSTGAVTWDWDFGDLTPPTTTATDTVDHHYAGLGPYTVKVTVSDGGDPAATAEGSTTVQLIGANFTSTQTPQTLTVTFTDKSDGAAPTSWHWDFDDGQSSNQQNPTHTYNAAGSYNVKLTVGNAGGSTYAQQTVKVDPLPLPNNPPTAEFKITPNPAGIGSEITLDASKSTDPDPGQTLTLSYAWDLDDDGQFDDGTGVTQSIPPLHPPFDTPGTYPIGLKVTDSSGASDKAFRNVTFLADKAPTVSFNFTPAAPSVGDAVTFTATAGDPDGTVAKLEWDLDDDGQFDDGTAATVHTTFATPGSRIVAVQATDNDGVPTVAFRTLTVAAAPAAPAAPAASIPALPPAPPAVTASKVARMLSPFPIVHIRGQILRTVTKIQLFSVKAPKGAIIKIRCRGRSCKRARLTRRVRSGSRSERFSTLERRMRAGTVIEVFVTSPGRVGKYTKLTLRRRAAPARRDMCAQSVASGPILCPA